MERVRRYQEEISGKKEEKEKERRNRNRNE